MGYGGESGICGGELDELKMDGSEPSGSEPSGNEVELTN